MESIKSWLKKNKMDDKGQTLNLATGTVMGVMIFIFMVFAVLFAISTLNPAGFFTAASSEANATGDLTKNLTAGVSKFGSYIPTIMTVIAVVVVLAAIVILVAYVKNMNAGQSQTGL